MAKNKTTSCNTTGLAYMEISGGLTPQAVYITGDFISQVVFIPQVFYTTGAFITQVVLKRRWSYTTGGFYTTGGITSII